MQLALRSGRTIKLVRLQQSLTYAGLLLGQPHRRHNAALIARLLEEARRLEYGGHPPYLVPPVVTAFEPRRPSPRVLRALGARPRLAVDGEEFHEFERLPAVASMGVFDSGELQRSGSREPYSSLIVVWFQDLFGPPIAEPVRTHIEGLDWERLAMAWCP